MGSSEIKNAAQHSIDAAFMLVIVHMSAVGQQPSSSQGHMRVSFGGAAGFVCKITGAHLIEREEDFGRGLAAA